MGPVFDQITDELVELTRAGYQMIRDGDPAFLDLIDPDVEWHVPDTFPGGGALRGHWEVLAFLDASAQIWEDPHPEPHELLPSGDTLVVLGDWCGRARATGISVAVPFAHVSRFRGGLLVYFRNYIDAAEVAKALEVPPSG
jgi:uncharacterized protein